MNGGDDKRADVIIALLAQLVASTTEGDEVLALSAAGLKPADIARILNMKPNAVQMRIARARAKGGT